MPAVTVPVSLKAGFSPARPSAEVSGANAAVRVDHAALAFDRNNFVREFAFGLGLCGPFVAFHGEDFLFVAGNLILLGKVFGRLAHGDIGVVSSIDEDGIGHGIEARDGHAGHALNPGAYENVSGSQLYGASGLVNSLHG